MNNLPNYYERKTESNNTINSERFPKNHVRFSPLLFPLKWISYLFGLFGIQAFTLKKAIIKEYDSAAPLGVCLGDKSELQELKRHILTYCRGIDNNQYLSTIGRFLLKSISLNSLKNRKKVLKLYYSNKEFIDANGNFNAPLLITGFPRSGTTLLQRLISEDPNTRSPYTFELEIPVPPMPFSINPMQDPRIKKSGAVISSFSKLAPGFMEKFSESHYWSPTELEESFAYMLAHNCINVMNNATAGKNYVNNFFSIKAIRPVFRYERLFFTVLDAYRPVKSHWTLKAPDYAAFFPVLFEEYPDAKVVITHRNPINTFPSICRLMESWHIAFDQGASFDKHRFAQFQQLFFEKYIQVPFEYRKKHPEKESQIYDCMYEDFFSNPIETVKSIYRKYNLEYTNEFEERMKIYLQNNKQGKYGRHKYSLEEYGFTAEKLYHRYKDYMDHYGYSIPEKIKRPTSFNFSIKS